MKRFGMSWSGAGSNSWTNEPTDKTAGACSQIDARGSNQAPLFVYLLHPLYSLLTLLIPVYSVLQVRKGQITSSRFLSFSLSLPPFLFLSLFLSSVSRSSCIFTLVLLLFLPFLSLFSSYPLPSIYTLIPLPLSSSALYRFFFFAYATSLFIYEFIFFSLSLSSPLSLCILSPCTIHRRIFSLALSLISPMHIRLMQYRDLVVYIHAIPFA